MRGTTWTMFLMTLAGCGAPTPEAAAEALVVRALDEVARRDLAAAEVTLESALRLDRASTRAFALRDLVRPPELVLEFYDVRDLSRVPDFPGVPVEVEVEGGGSAGCFSFDTEEPDELVDLIERVLGADGPGSIERSQGILIVRQPLRAHEEIVRLLDALRRAPVRTAEGRGVASDEALARLGIELRR